MELMRGILTASAQFSKKNIGVNLKYGVMVAVLFLECDSS